MSGGIANDAQQMESFSQGLRVVTHISASKLVRDASPGPYLDWIAQHGASIAEGVLPADMRGPAHAVDASRMMRLMGHMIYAAMPLPQHHFQPKRLPLPGRNDPCLCGSLAKFKQCCEPMVATLPRLPPESAMAQVLDAMGKKAWRELPAHKAPPRLVEAAAHDFLQEDRVADAVSLLEPWAAHPGRLPAAWAELLDLLGDCYAQLQKPRKRKALAESMIERGEPAVQSKGWQRLCLMHTDGGKHGEAEAAFAHAQRLMPDDPSLSLLEVSMQLGFGNGERARERAQFHVRRLGRNNDGGRFDELIETLNQIAERGHDFLEDAELQQAPDLQRVGTWLTGLPPPQLRIDLHGCTDEDFGPLTPLPPVAKLLRRWEKVFQIGSPTLVALHTDSDAWQGYESWMKLLEAEPLLADSFEVQDGLLLALESHPSGGAAAAVARRLIARCLALWALLRERHPRARSEWAVWPNRPAMRVLAQHIAGDPTLTAEHSFEWLRHMVDVLNPNDNHGFRSRLALVYLRRGLHEQALALTARYPDDMDDMALARVLALWHAQQRGAATTLLADTLRASPHLVKVLRSTRRPKPRHDGYIEFGSLQAAQQAYADQFDLWQAPGLRMLIDSVTRTLKR